MKALLFVFLGGGAGSILRYVVSKSLNDVHQNFPVGTFVANSLGSLLIGILIGLAMKNKWVTEPLSLLLITGFCGGFTTFSTFAYENHVLLKDGNLLYLAAYTLISVVIAILLVFFGAWLTK